MENIGSAWNTSTGWRSRPSISYGWHWRTGKVGRCLQSMTASTWNQRATGTDCGWDNTAATQGTPSHGTTTRPSLHWIETKTVTQVCPPPPHPPHPPHPHLFVGRETVSLLTLPLSIFFYHQVTVLTTKKAGGGTTCAPTPIWMVFGIEADTIAAAIKTGSTGPSSTEGPTLSNEFPWWLNQYNLVEFWTREKELSWWTGADISEGPQKMLR